MKLNLLFNLVLFLTFSSELIYGNFLSTIPAETVLTKTYIQEVLTNHDWSLAELVETTNGEAKNITPFILPCEKDNILNYDIDGKYQINEGKKFCQKSNNEILGTGTWEFDEEQKILIDAYGDGRPLDKKILELTPEMLKLEFEGEGGKINTLTYLSEIGLKDDMLRFTIDDNSNHAKNIAMIPRETLAESGRYIIVGLKDFQTGILPEVNDINGLLKKVVIYPLIDSTNPDVSVMEKERNAKVIEQSQKMDLDYIITGNVLRAKSKKNPKGGYLGDIKYIIYSIDVKTGKEQQRETIEYTKKPSILNIIPDLPYPYIPGIMNPWSPGAIGMRAVFSSVNSAERNTHYQSSVAIKEAIGKTEKKLTDFIKESIPLNIPVNSTDSNNSKKGVKILIEAGSNISIEVGEKLNLVRLNEIKMRDGSTISSTDLIGEIKVTEITASQLSTCEPINSGQAKKIKEALAKYPIEEFFVQTTGK